MIQQELDYLYALSRFGIKPGLTVMQQMMEALEHPERTFKSIHVTGTNGKGSTCAIMESILREAGYNTALYTSPHLYIFNERIQINRVPITDETLAGLVKEIREVCERHDIHPTFFEFTTALAFLYFSRSNIDIAIIEVGMGGLYDATNVITPLVSVITNVGLDHTEYFGPTKAHVAREKAGIIKQEVPVVVGERDPEILAIFDTEAQRQHAQALLVDDVVNAELISAGLERQEVNVRINTAPTPSNSPSGRGRDRDSSPFQGEAGWGEGARIYLPLLGLHQIDNMKIACTALAVLATQGDFSFPKESVISGIANTNWEGRLQIISRNPLIVIDGAHNGDGAKALAHFLKRLQRYDMLVFAAKKGKDISDMLKYVVPLFPRVIVTEGSFMPESAEYIAEKIRAMGKEVIVEVSPGKAFDLGRSSIDKDSTMVVTGSLYMVADVLAHSKRSEV